jgi:protein O-GlcNAc transferase
MNNKETLFQRAIVSLNAGNLVDAERLFRSVLKSQPRHIGALNFLTVVLMAMARYGEAEEFIRTAVKLDQSSDVSFYNYGIILKGLGRPREALEQFSFALRLKPDVSETWNNRGTAFNDLREYQNAISDFDKAIALHQNYAEAYANKGKSLGFLKRYNDALSAYDKALAVKPNLAEALLGRGNIFAELKRYDEAFSAYDKALALKPDLPEAWLGRGNIFAELKRYDEAFSAYDKALLLKPDLDSAEGDRLHSKMRLCDWTNLTLECEHLLSSVSNLKTNTSPFALLAISTSPEDQLKCAKLWVNKQYRRSGKPFWDGKIQKHKRIRVAYVSADFHQHATAYLMAGVFELHDRSRFELTAISIGPPDTSEMRQRLKASFDHFIDARLFSDDDIASLVRDAEIDILVDLKGFTLGARTGIFARCPAPILVNYLGYPGTMGAEYMDYLVADHTVVPETAQDHYTEKIVYLPDSYQANDTKRTISGKLFTRTECGIPESGFVFCCFNDNYKIVPEVFDCWMRILHQVNDSVLWLLESNVVAASNLRKEAAARGIDAERLIFAPFIPLADHLARIRLADLFLDTLPYNAHTTASDALWAGVPVLTQIGKTFAGRVGASLLNAIGLPELITSTRQKYTELAIELAMNPGKFAAIKHTLWQNRLTTPLFNTHLFTRHIEQSYVAMHERYQAGLPPEHIYVPS